MPSITVNLPLNLALTKVAFFHLDWVPFNG